MDENEKVINLEKENEVEKPKEIQVITGNGELMISPVYEHLEVEKPKQKDTRTIVVPEVKKTSQKKEDNTTSEDLNTDKKSSDAIVTEKEAN